MAPERHASTTVADGIDRLLSQALAGSDPDGAGRPARVLDLGGGTGGLAVRLAAGGHDVTVVDPSPDALAALARRADEAGVSDRVRGLQGDAEGLGDLLADADTDLVLCHGVLEVVDDPAVALRAVRAALRPGGRLSLLVAQRHGAALARVGAGHLRQALHLLSDPHGRWGTDDPLLRRFDLDGVRDLLGRCGLRVLDVEGTRVFTDLAPRGADEDPQAAELLAALEDQAAGDDAYLRISAQLHLHATPDPGA